MSMTYADTPTEAHAEEAAFVPRYARTTKARKPAKTWMILAPIGGVVALGAAAAMMMGGEPAAPAMTAETTTMSPQASPAAIIAAQTPVTPAAPADAPAAAPMPVEAAPAETPRRAEPAVRRAAPVAQTPAARVETPMPTADPQPYAAPSEASPRVVVAPVAATLAPTISVQPLN
ncbi:MAG: hypothetical protein ACK4MI_06280 [Brevundimonas sp.]|uniref:hypothetical protein n=1 Tax=Brevundimonas sp. TaxID=1871086 RepID=UPI0028D3A107|nr:hypothetical protein [uncultured Brevundimonas sp.]